MLKVVFDALLREKMEDLVAEENCEILQLHDEGGVLTAIIGKEAPVVEMLKVSPVKEYPTEPGCFLRGNDYSPVAVVVLLNAPYGTLPPEVQNAPPEIEKLVRVAVETGAALAGTLQTENIGIEKIVCNVVGNPNIRYLVLCGEEVHGHNSGTAVKALLANGINEKRTIIGSEVRTWRWRPVGGWSATPSTSPSRSRSSSRAETALNDGPRSVAAGLSAHNQRTPPVAATATGGVC